MQELVWDDELAHGAKLWAEQCNFKHDNNHVCRFKVYITPHNNYKRKKSYTNFLRILIFFQSKKIDLRIKLPSFENV